MLQSESHTKRIIILPILRRRSDNYRNTIKQSSQVKRLVKLRALRTVHLLRILPVLSRMDGILSRKIRTRALVERVETDSATAVSDSTAESVAIAERERERGNDGGWDEWNGGSNGKLPRERERTESCNGCGESEGYICCCVVRGKR